MEIKDLNGLGLPQKIEKAPANEIKTNKKSEPREAQAPPAKSEETDRIEISDQAKELQNAGDEIRVAKQLLAKLPSFRAHVIYEALAKLRAGLYSDEQIMSEVASKLVEGNELRDITNS